ncbi:MAG: hypothetical protein AB7E70_08670 [Hyphomicrobiaceae bacterium]
MRETIAGFGRPRRVAKDSRSDILAPGYETRLPMGRHEALENAEDI